MPMRRFSARSSRKHHPTADYVAALREELPKEFPGTSFFFEPADIVSQTLNFGLPARSTFRSSARTRRELRGSPRRLRRRCATFPVRSTFTFSSRSISRVCSSIWIGSARSRWGSRRGMSSSSLLVSLSSSYQTAPNLWLNPKNGVSYNIAVQTPQYRIASLELCERFRSRAPAPPSGVRSSLKTSPR